MWVGARWLKLGDERQGKNSYDVGDKEKERNRKLKVNI